MQLLYATTYEAILNATAPKVLVNVGCDIDRITKLLKYCTEHGSVLHVVSPTSIESLEELQHKYNENLIIHEDLGLNALPAIKQVEFITLDSDYNWYTVYHTLLTLQNHTTDTHKDNFPVTVITNTGWPYGKRDVYLRPECIPLAYQQATSTGGLIPGKGKPNEKEGIFQGRAHAMYEGTPRNGVLAAIEDFIEQSPLHFRTLLLPGAGGHGILIPESLSQKK